MHPSLELNYVLMSQYGSKDVCLSIAEGWLDGLEDIGTSASKAAKGFLFSLMQPGQDFFMSVIILKTPGTNNLDFMCERTWRTSRPCPSSACAAFTMHFAKMVFLQTMGTPIWDR